MPQGHAKLEFSIGFKHAYTMRNMLSFVCYLVMVCVSMLQPVLADRFSDKRLQMISEIQHDVKMTSQFIDRDAFDERVMQVMNDVPRHEFVPQSQISQAYENRPLPIGFGQTISQPYIVALMTDLLQPQPEHRVLEIGTGSGYQAAVLSKLVEQVYSIEIIERLAKNTDRLFRKLGYGNIETLVADGYNGWTEHAPFDGIVVTAAISHIPPPLVQQLKKGGRMVIPVGTRFQTQYLTLLEKDKQGQITSRKLLPVRFVPFTGGH